jgi:hypothetical protein
MPDYTKTKIYKIESHLGDEIYIGSTTKEYLSQRFQQHKNSYRRWKQEKCGKCTSYDLFELYGIENCFITLIEECNCSSKNDKNSKEGNYIKTLKCVNKNIAGRTTKEYYQSEEGKEAHKKYYQSEKGKEMRKKYYQLEEVKQKAKEYNQSEEGKENIKKSIKKYFQSEKGKETIKKLQKKYYQRKLEKLNKNQNEETNLI